MGWRPFRAGDDPAKAVRCTCPPVSTAKYTRLGVPCDPPRVVAPTCPVHGGRVLQTSDRGSTPGNPISNEMDLAVRLQELCGAEGYRIEGNQVLALRWSEGREIVIDRFELSKVNG